MYRIEKNYSLRTLNTFGFDVKAMAYTVPSNVEQLRSILREQRDQYAKCLVLGGGSNLLFTSDYTGLVIHPQMGGIEKISEDNETVCLRVGAGVVWDDLVAFAVDAGWGGLENLSNIPGNVGASPVQNVGAYGVEAKDCIELVEGIYLDDLSAFQLTNADCCFAYRDSVFKQRLRNKIVISHVHFRLQKNPRYVINYGNVEEELKKYDAINLATIRQAIISIRKYKLPDPREIGNAGSFFKNPMVETAIAEQLKQSYPQMPSYPMGGSLVKLAAGWLIDQCGLKGFRNGQVGVHQRQALVLVNYGGGSATALKQLAEHIQKTVYNKFGVRLEPEVNYV